MKLKDVREITGLSERTLKSYIQQGRLEATLVGSGQHRHWEINPESLGRIQWKPKDDTDNTQQSDQQLLITAQQHQLEIYERELEAKNKQIEQLHILLQQAQAALPAPRENRPWWKLWRK